MRVRVIRFVFVFCAAIFFAGATHAQQTASPDQAIALVKKAVAFYRAEGKAKAFAAFADPKGGFQTNDLYIFVQDLKGDMLLHGRNPGLNGKDLIGLKDADGKPFVAEMVKVATGKGSGWVDYRWVDPATRKIEPKSSYIERVDDMFFGAGIYKH